MQGMGAEPIDPRWPRLLGLAVHEFRTPITVVAGYIRMLLRDRAGAITDQQRKLLEEAEKSCGRLSALVSEMSDLSALEAGSAALNRGAVDLGALLAEVIAGLPELQDRPISVELQTDGNITLHADAGRLRLAMTSLLLALRRELITSPRLLVRTSREADGRVRIAIADPDLIDAVTATEPARLSVFNEWRGGSGLSLAVARRIIAQHGGLLYGPVSEEDKACAVVLLPA
jgi:signal transduction histidine kinase